MTKQNEAVTLQPSPLSFSPDFLHLPIFGATVLRHAIVGQYYTGQLITESKLDPDFSNNGLVVNTTRSLNFRSHLILGTDAVSVLISAGYFDTTDCDEETGEYTCEPTDLIPGLEAEHDYDQDHWYVSIPMISAHLGRNSASLVDHPTFRARADRSEKNFKNLNKRLDRFNLAYRNYGGTSELDSINTDDENVVLDSASPTGPGLSVVQANQTFSQERERNQIESQHELYATMKDMYDFFSTKLNWTSNVQKIHPDPSSLKMVASSLALDDEQVSSLVSSLKEATDMYRLKF